MKKGFTILEVLAVVIILGIIAAITFPIVKNVVNENRKKTFESSVRGMIRSAELYVSANPTLGDTTFPYNTTAFKMEKNSMTGGTIIYTETTGKISVEKITDGILCATGDKTELKIKEVNKRTGAC